MKNKKLLVRVGIMIAVFFTVLIIVLGTVIYTGTTTMYLNAKNEMIDRDLIRVRDMVEDIPLFNTMAEYWKTHIDDIKRDVSEEEYIAGCNVYDSVGFAPTKEVFDSLSDIEKLIMAHDLYDGLSLGFNEEQLKFSYGGLYLVGITEENCGFVICKGNGDVLVYRESLGSSMDIDISTHNAAQKIRSGNYNATEYEIVDNVDGKSYYIGYAPVGTGDAVKYAVCILYDWSQFKKGLQDNLIVMAVIGISVMVIAGGILLSFLYRTAIRPVTKIQSAVRDYIVLKDSYAVIGKMREITANNEVGKLAGDISSLAEEMERFTGEIIKLTGEQERVAAELDLATKIQSGSLPNDFPAFPDRKEFDLYASMTPAKEVGGDFYDFFLIDDDHLVLVIADVSGKGVPAALFMMSSMILLRDRALMGGTPSEILEFVNERICEKNPLEMFVTVWLGILEISTGKLSCANAGHEIPEIKHGDEFGLFKDKHGFVVGGMSGIKYRTYDIQLEKGDAVFVYTDGVAEATNASNELFGTARLSESLNTLPDGSPEKLITTVKKAVDDFVNGAPQFDDLTMLCLKYIG